MSLTGNHLDAILAAGATAEQIVALVKADIAEREIVTGERRAKDAERQRRHRESRIVTVTPSDTDGQGVTPSLNKEIPRTPKEIKPIPSPPYKPPASQARGKRLPEDFEPPEDWIAWAMKKRSWSHDAAEDEAECFVRYWQAKPGREACKLDWPKTWQNWVVNSRRRPDDVRAGVWDGMP